MRDEAYRCEVAYLTRLDGLAGNIDTTVLERAKVAGGASRGVTASLGRAFGRIHMLFRFVFLVPSLVVQIRRMNTARRAAKTGGGLIVASASNRLKLAGESGSARERMAAFTRALGERPSSEIADRVSRAEYVLLCDALPLSRLWQHRDRCWQDNIFIVDAAFVLLHQVGRLITRPIRSLGTVVRLARQCAGLRDLAYALLAHSYEEVLNGSEPIEAVFLTSNSTLTEVLRGYLLQWTGCRVIYEVMHGIGSLPAERFFANVLSAVWSSGSDAKHRFIPQLPGLPLYGVLRAHVHGWGDVAINAYLNRYFIERGQGIEQLIEAEYRALKGNIQSDSPVIITLFGNVTTAPGLEAASFRAECVLLRMIADARTALKRDCLVLYVPHPAYHAGAFRADVLAESGVVLYRDSVFCWLISDLCVSLLSSAMFEGAYFGAPAFTPMIPADDFYNTAYLDALNYPGSGSFDDLRGGFRSFLDKGFSAPRRDVQSRARERLKLMNSGT